MKKNVFFASMVALLFLLACAKENGDQMLCGASPNSDTVKFSLNLPVNIFNTCSPGMQATVTQINDSRCPKGAQCVWQGNLTTQLSLNNQISLQLEMGKQKDTIYQNVRYSFLLVDATPYPEVNQSNPSEKKVLITIKKQ